VSDIQLQETSDQTIKKDLKKEDRKEPKQRNKVLDENGFGDEERKV
jgi:hypothetical protein